MARNQWVADIQTCLKYNLFDICGMIDTLCNYNWSWHFGQGQISLAANDLMLVYP